MTLHINENDNLFGAHITMTNFLPDDDPMLIFSRDIFFLFNDNDFEDCYSEVGRGAISPSFLSMVTLLQYRENLSDEETTEACARRLDWKIALHLRVDEKNFFDSSTLSKFRARLKKNEKCNYIFDKILEQITKKGFIKRATSQRIDATHIISHVNRIATTDLLFRTVKCVIEEIQKKDKEYFKKHVPELLKERYLNKFSSFGMSKDSRYEKQAEIIEDGYFLKSLLCQTKSDKLKNLDQLSIMETIFNENVMIKKKYINNKEVIEVEEIRSPKQSIFDPRDTSLQMGVKGKKSWVGSKCHVIETAERGKTNFLTGMIYQSANESDQRIHEKVINNNIDKNFNPKVLYADQNYISGKSIYRYEKENQKLLGRIHDDTTEKPEKFKLKNFEIDIEKIKARCPLGKESEKFSLLKNGLYNIYFSKTDCSVCNSFKECIGDCKDKRRRLNVSPFYKYIQGRRLLQETKKFKKEMRVRAQIEGTISEMVRKNGLRLAKYHGAIGHQLQFYLTGAALNLKRYLRVMV